MINAALRYNNLGAAVPSAQAAEFIVLLFAVLPGVHSFAQSSAVRSSVTQPTPVNLGFEQGETGEVPAGWLSPTVQFGYAARLTEENPKSGKRCAVLYSEANPTQFGNLMQAIDAVVYRGKRVRFKAAVRVEPSDQSARAQLWLRVDRKDQKAGFFDNMGDRPIRTPQLGHVPITAPGFATRRASQERTTMWRRSIPILS